MYAPADTPRSSPTRATDLFARVTRIPLVVSLLALQLPLILNPGYFSHDELQWWARADVPSWSALPWIPWLDLSPLQYRPLTFNLWLVLAHAFEVPAGASGGGGRKLGCSWTLIAIVIVGIVLFVALMQSCGSCAGGDGTGSGASSRGVGVFYGGK